MNGCFICYPLGQTRKLSLENLRYGVTMAPQLVQSGASIHAQAFIFWDYSCNKLPLPGPHLQSTVACVFSVTGAPHILSPGDAKHPSRHRRDLPPGGLTHPKYRCAPFAKHGNQISILHGIGLGGLGAGHHSRHMGRKRQGSSPQGLLVCRQGS